MAIHLYTDSGLTQQISEGTLASPDSDTYNGTDGQAKDRELFIANEQTTLAANITSTQTSITDAGLVRADTQLVVTRPVTLAVDSELLVLQRLVPDLATRQTIYAVLIRESHLIQV